MSVYLFECVGLGFEFFSRYGGLGDSLWRMRLGVVKNLMCSDVELSERCFRCWLGAETLMLLQ